VGFAFLVFDMAGLVIQIANEFPLSIANFPWYFGMIIGRGSRNNFLKIAGLQQVKGFICWGLSVEYHWLIVVC